MWSLDCRYFSTFDKLLILLINTIVFRISLIKLYLNIRKVISQKPNFLIEHTIYLKFG